MENNMKLTKKYQINQYGPESDYKIFTMFFINDIYLTKVTIPKDSYTHKDFELNKCTRKEYVLNGKLHLKRFMFGQYLNLVVELSERKLNLLDVDYNTKIKMVQ